MSDDQSYADVRWRAQQANPSREPLSTTYTDIRCRQLEGTFPGDPMAGVWPISANRIYCGWGNVTESEWPQVRSAKEWPPAEPPGLDNKAKRHRSHFYQRIRSSHDCCRMLGTIMPINGAFEITEQWFDAEHGAIKMPAAGDSIVGSHAVCIVGFDIAHQLFMFVNSWGEEWGAGGFGYLPFEYFDKYLVEASVLHGTGALPKQYQGDCDGAVSLVWGNFDVLWKPSSGGSCVVHGREFHNGDTDDRMGWAFLSHREEYLDIEELFVKPAHRRAGIARQIIELIRELSQEVNRPLRMPIAFADWTNDNYPGVVRVCELLDLEIVRSPWRWAAAMALPRDRNAWNHGGGDVPLSMDNIARSIEAAATRRPANHLTKVIKRG